MQGTGARDVIVNFCRERMRTPSQAIAVYTELLMQSLEKALRESPGALALLDLRKDASLIARAGKELEDTLDRLGDGADAAEDEDAFLELIRHNLRNSIGKVRMAAEEVMMTAEETPGGRRIAADAADLVAEADRAVEILKEVGEDTRDADRNFDLFKVLQQGIRAASFEDDEKIGRGSILIIDSDPSMGALMKGLVERFDCECDLVESGAAAFDYIARRPVDLILTDLVLGDMTGFDILKRLKDENNATPTIIVSSIENEKFLVACIRMGARDYLPKPPSTTLLKARIRAALERKFFEDRSRELLYSILPERIAREWSPRGDKMFAERFEASVLFTDIVGFTSLSRDRKPDHVIIFLNEVFSEIDRLIEQHGVRKIKTIGDAYMVAAGLPDPEKDPRESTRRLADFALKLSSEIESATRELCEITGLPPLKMRIGMHSGPVVAGVIGQQKPAYDVWGDTVNMASRMESAGEPGRVHVSETVQTLLTPEYDFEARAPISVKGIGEVSTFFLTGRR